MSENQYMNALTRWFRALDDEVNVDVELIATLALVKELQILNKTLKELLEEQVEGKNNPPIAF